MRDDEDVSGWWYLWMLVVMVPLGLWRAYVISTIWNWFIPGIGGPSIGIARAFGFSIILGILITSRIDTDSKERHPFATMIGWFLLPLLFLVEAWVVQKYL